MIIYIVAEIYDNVSLKVAEIILSSQKIVEIK